MTIAKTTSRVAYAGNDSTTAFAYGYRFFADGDLQVYILVDSTGVQTLQTLTTHYTVSNNGDETGGTVTMVTAPATGETLTFLRAVPQTQSTDYATNDAFPAESHEAALDRVTLVSQELGERMDRALIVQESDDAIGNMPTSVDRASKYLAFDASGDPIASAAPEGGNVVSTFMGTMLDDVDAATANATLNIFPPVLTTGTTTAFVLTLATGPASYVEGQIFDVIWHAVPAAGATLNVNALGAVSIKQYATSGLLVDPTGAGQAYQTGKIRYDGTQMVVILGPAYNATSGLPGVVKVLDEDDMASDHTGWPPSQQATKAYADARLGAPSFVLEDQKTSGTAGGTATSGSWETRDLNTEVRDVDGLVSVSSNEFTSTAAGWVEWAAPAREVGNHQTRLYNVTDASVAGTGTIGRSNTTDGGDGTSVGGAAILAAKAYRVEHKVGATQATDGHGGAGSFGTEVYTRVKFWRT